MYQRSIQAILRCICTPVRNVVIVIMGSAMRMISFLLVLLLAGCTFKDERDPLRYKGCVVINKWTPLNGLEIKLKLTHQLRDSLSCDYMWISVPRWEYDQLNIGDTIK